MTSRLPPSSRQVTVALTVDRTETYNLSVTLDDVYRVDGARATERFETTETVATPVDPGPVRALGGPLLLGLALASSAASESDDHGTSSRSRRPNASD